MYAAPPVIQTEIFTTLPKELHNSEKYSAWVTERRAGKLHSFLEGPSFDRADAQGEEEKTEGGQDAAITRD